MLCFLDASSDEESETSSESEAEDIEEDEVTDGDEGDDDDNDSEEPMSLSDDELGAQNEDQVDDVEGEAKEAAHTWEHPKEDTGTKAGKVKSCKCVCKKFLHPERGRIGCIEQFTKEEQNEQRYVL